MCKKNILNLQFVTNLVALAGGVITGGSFGGGPILCHICTLGGSRGSRRGTETKMRRSGKTAKKGNNGNKGTKRKEQETIEAQGKQLGVPLLDPEAA